MAEAPGCSRHGRDGVPRRGQGLRRWRARARRAGRLLVRREPGQAQRPDRPFGLREATSGTSSQDTSATRGEALLDAERVEACATRLLVFQETALFPWMTVWTTSPSGLSAAPRCRAAPRTTEARACSKTSAPGFAHRYPIQLSDGMHCRVELARAIIDSSPRHADGRAVPWPRRHHAPAHAGDDAPRCSRSSGGPSLSSRPSSKKRFLADRLSSSRATARRRAKKIIYPDLLRPRSYQALASPRYLALKEEALEALHEEALQAFAAGTAAAYDLVEAHRKRTGG